MGYPKEPLSSRAVVKPGLYAVIPESGLVNNVIPGVRNCRVSIVCSPKIGAGFVQYIITAQSGGGTAKPLVSGENEEGFIYVIEGEVEVSCLDKTLTLTDGGYLYAPAGNGIAFNNKSDKPAKLLLYKQIYKPLEGKKPYIVSGNINDVPYRIYDDMENVFIKDFLPTDDLAFDMNMHILAFAPGGCHPFVETHVQEHGAYMLSGEGMYLLEDIWMPIKKNDFIWFGPYVQQGAYGVGRELFAYIYSKDCNRDVTL